MNEEKGNDTSSKCYREKTFDELNAEERVARLHQIVIRLDQQLHEHRRLVEELRNHQHGADGTVLVALERLNR